MSPESAWAPSSIRATAAASSTRAPTEDLVERATINGKTASLQDLPDPCRHHPRHHRRSRRQSDDGEGGADAGGAGHRHGGAQFRRHRHRPGRARGRERQPQSASGENSRRAGRLRRRRQPENHWQTFGTPYNPAFSGEIRVRAGSLPPMPMSPRKIIARRAAFELKPNSVVNLGIGMPDGVAAVANEEKIIDLITMTAEPGVIGGIPARASISARPETRRRSSTSPTSSISTTAAGSTSPSSASRRSTGRQSQRLEIRAEAGRRRRLHQHLAECQEGGVRRHLRRGADERRGARRGACTSSRTRRSASSSIMSSMSRSAANTPPQAGAPSSTSPSAASSRCAPTGWS
jgi:hypothetical protein